MKLGSNFIFLLVRNQVTHLKECRKDGGMYYVPFQTKKFSWTFFSRAALMTGYVSIMCCLPRWDFALPSSGFVGLGYWNPPGMIPVAPPKPGCCSSLRTRARALCVSGRGLADHGTRVCSVLAEIATLPFVLQGYLVTTDWYRTDVRKLFSDPSRCSPGWVCSLSLSLSLSHDGGLFAFCFLAFLGNCWTWWWWVLCVSLLFLVALFSSSSSFSPGCRAQKFFFRRERRRKEEEVAAAPPKRADETHVARQREPCLFFCLAQRR